MSKRSARTPSTSSRSAAGPTSSKLAARRRGRRSTRNDAYWGAKGAVPDGRLPRRAGRRDARRRSADRRRRSRGHARQRPGGAAQSRRPSVKPLIVLTERVGYLRMNTTKPPFDDVQGAPGRSPTRSTRRRSPKASCGGYDKPVAGIADAGRMFGWVDGIKGIALRSGKGQGAGRGSGPAAKARRSTFATSPVYDQRVVQAHAADAAARSGSRSKIDDVRHGHVSEAPCRADRTTPACSASAAGPAPARMPTA